MKKINFLAPISARVKDMEKLFKMTSEMYLMDSFGDRNEN